MKKIVQKIIVFFYTLRLKWRGNLYNFKRAVRKAQRAEKRTYVYFIGGRYRVFNRKDIQRLKIKGAFKQGVNTHTLSKICLYDTMDGVLRHPNPKYNRFKP